MGFTPEQIKGRIKSVAKQNNADARTLMRIYMMERFLERLTQSEYRDNFIIKGGILVTAMIGVAHRSTMDIDTSMKNLNLRRMLCELSIRSKILTLTTVFLLRLKTFPILWMKWSIRESALP